MKIRIRLAILLSAAGMVTALAGAVPAAASEIGPYRVINYNSGKCMDVHDNGDSDIVKQYSCHGKANQLWHFKHQANGGYFMIMPHYAFTRSTPLCLEMPNWSETSGEDAKVRDCITPPWAASNEGWSLSGTGNFQLPTAGEQFRYRFVNWFSGMCLEVDGGSGSNSARVQQAPCDGSARQLWIVMH